MNPNPVPTGTAASSATSACSSRRRQGVRLAVATALVAGGAVAAPASASVVGTMSAGYSVMVVHNIDLIAVTGPAGTAGETATVEVKRGAADALVARARGPLVQTDEGPMLEVNHGPEGAPAAGDCWDSAAANNIVQEGDRVEVSVAGAVKAVVIVDELQLRPAQDGGNEVVVPFFLKKADGSAPAGLDGGYRGPSDNQFRADATIRKHATAADTYELVYTAPTYGVTRNRNGLDPKTELLSGDGHSAMFGHIDGAPESQVVEGRDNSSGPAPGCPAPAPIGGGGGGGGVDTAAPSRPGSLIATPVTSRQIKLDWDASTDNIGVTGYKISRAGAATVDVGTSPTTYTATGLAASTSYTFSVTAVDAAGNESPAATVTASTPEDTPAPGDLSLTIADRRSSEGDPRRGDTRKAFNFAVRLSAASTGAVTVRYATSPGTAKANDYDHTAGTLTIPAGTRTVNVTVPVVRDNRNERNETFTVTLSQPSGAKITDELGRGTIVDDD